MLQLKRNSLSVALACALLAVASGAQAQSDAPSTATPDPVAADDKAKAAAKAKAEAETKGASEMEVISVVGIRRGIESAIALKQDSTSIIEAEVNCIRSGNTAASGGGWSSAMARVRVMLRLRKR